MTYTIYNVDTGEICRVVSCDPERISDQITNQAHGYIEGGFDDSLFYIIEKTAVAMPQRPSDNHVFNYSTKQWEDPRTLADLKAAQWTQIKQARTAFIDAPLVTPYGTFDSDAAGRTSITDAVLLANNLTALSLPVAIEFTLADNSVVTLDAAQIVEVGLLLGQKVQHAHPHSQALRAQIEAATTKEEVEAVVW